MNLSSLKINRAYRITYRCRDIGHGTETGNGEFVYRGQFDDWGKHKFTPVGSGPEIYLFPDEVTDVKR